jgi:hypothetical protein
MKLELSEQQQRTLSKNYQEWYEASKPIFKLIYKWEQSRYEKTDHIEGYIDGTIGAFYEVLALTYPLATGNLNTDWVALEDIYDALAKDFHTINKINLKIR